eukprot:TRINITY_DN720_c0_g1_i2.p1 TRINITY_DN720_c0_g1~~TRINITY_DN720_c0_g1_i2.p1  ORF type:complete len:211 (+),score=46.73 TRINITY_DN720_c0_g1_i2:329-961(+)
MFKSFWGAQEQQTQSNQQEIPAGTRYPTTVTSSKLNSSHTATSSSSHAEAEIIVLLKDKNVDELRKLLSNKDMYNTFLNSLEQVKIQNKLWDELQKETMQLVRENLEKEPRTLELRNQCQIIRTTELAAAQERLHELERQGDENLRFYTLPMLLQRMKDAMNEAEDESEMLHRQLLDKERDLPDFVNKYRRLRTTYHRRALLHLAATASA